MKNWIIWTFIGASIIATVLAVIAIAMVAPTQTVDFDYLGAIIGVLSLLVTVLIGYQIYTIINVKEEIKSLQNIRSELDMTVEKKAQETKEFMNEELNNIVPLLVSLDLNEPVQLVAVALEIFCESKPDSLSRSFSDELCRVMLNNICGYDKLKKEQTIELLENSANKAYVAKYYAHFTNLNAESKKRYGEVEAMLEKLIGLFDGDK